MVKSRNYSEWDVAVRLHLAIQRPVISGSFQYLEGRPSEYKRAGNFWNIKQEKLFVGQLWKAWQILRKGHHKK